MNQVEQTMEIIGIKTVRELAELCKVSEKTITGWKKNLPPNGEVLLNLFVENHKLKVELEKSDTFKRSIREYLKEGESK